MNLDLKETQCKHLYVYLVDRMSFKVIEMMAASDKAHNEGHHLKIQVKSKLAPNIVYHNAIINYLKRNGDEIIYPNGDVLKEEV